MKNSSHEVVMTKRVRISHQQLVDILSNGNLCELKAIFLESVQKDILNTKDLKIELNWTDEVDHANDEKDFTYRDDNDQKAGKENAYLGNVPKNTNAVADISLIDVDDGFCVIDEPINYQTKCKSNRKAPRKTKRNPPKRVNAQPAKLQRTRKRIKKPE